MFKILILTSVKILFISFLLISNALTDIVKKIKISGNERISDETLIVYGEIKKNKNYTQDDIDNIIKNLYDTKFIPEICVRIRFIKNILIKISFKKVVQVQ